MSQLLVMESPYKITTQRERELERLVQKRGEQLELLNAIVWSSAIFIMWVALIT